MHLLYKISFIYIINQNLNFLFHSIIIIDMMQNSIAKRQQIFRNSIRQQEIETYKKNRRKQLIQYDSQNIKEHNTYWKALEHHSLSQLSNMSSEILKDHLQMLYEIVFAKDSIFKDTYQNILVVLIDFYQESEKGWSKEFINRLSHINNTFDSLEIEQISDAYVLTQLFSFIPANMFFKLIGGIYYDINPQKNITYLKKTLRIIKNALNFSFTDSQTIKGLLCFNLRQHFDHKLNKTICKNILLTIILNISASEQSQIIRILKQEFIFQRLSNCLQLYGMTSDDLEVLSAIYGNSIEFLCQNIYQPPSCSYFEEFDQSQPKDNATDFLYLQFFNQFINLLDNKGIMQRMIFIAKDLLQTANKNNLYCKQHLLEQTQIIIRQIIAQDQYLPFCQHLFIILANQYNVSSAIWLTQFLKLILKGHLQAYYQINKSKQKYKMDIEQRKDKKQIPRDLNDLLKACQTLLSRTDQYDLNFQQYLVSQVFQFWCNEQVIMGYSQLITFMQVGIDHNPDLAHYIIFDKFEHQLVSFLLTDCKYLNQILCILKLINSTCDRLLQAQEELRKQHIRNNQHSWENMLHVLQGYSLNKQIASGQNLNFCLSIYEKVQSLLNQVIQQ